jgi:hypothetical protein
VGAAAQVVTGGGSPASEVLPEGDTNVMVEEVAAGDPVGSTGPTGDASSSTVAVDGCATVESEFILGHPMLRILGMFPLTRPWYGLLGTYLGSERALSGEWRHRQ